MTLALVSLAACVLGTIAVAVFDRPARPEPIRVPVRERRQ
jgi:energy-converting hydrogenase Eha subunit C